MSAAEEIARYFDLLKAGAITESEFATAKASLLGASQPGTSAVKNQAVGKPKENPKAVKKVQGNPNPLHTGVAVAAGVVGGRLIADQLLDGIQQHLPQRQLLFQMVTGKVFKSG